MTIIEDLIAAKELSDECQNVLVRRRAKLENIKSSDRSTSCLKKNSRKKLRDAQERSDWAKENYNNLVNRCLHCDSVMVVNVAQIRAVIDLKHEHGWPIAVYIPADVDLDTAQKITNRARGALITVIY